MSMSMKKIKRRRIAAQAAGSPSERRAAEPNWVRKAFSRGAQKSRPWRDNGREALSAWQLDEVARGMRGMERAEPPAEDMDQGAPWWAIIEHRPFEYGGKPSVLMGFAPKGAPLPDWEAIMRRAGDALRSQRKAEASLRAGAGAESYWPVKVTAEAISWKRRLAPESASGEESEHNADGELSWAGSERAAKLSISELVGHAQVKASRTGLKRRLRKRLKGKFDRRRAARRLGGSAPQAWLDVFGSSAQGVWENGAGAHLLKAKPQRDTENLLKIIMDSMLASGASSVQLCPDFQKLNPMAFESWEGFAEMDAGSLDAIRAGWAIESSTAACGELSRKDAGDGVQKEKRKTAL